MLITCQTCKKEFNAKGPAKFCSPECKRIARNARENPKTEKTCVNCGKTFIADRSDILCCSDHCKRAHTYRQNVDKFKIIRREQYRKDPERARQKTKEWREANPEKFKKMNREYHDKIRYGGNREKCFERDGYKCVKCGSVKQLIPHHIDGSGQTDSPNNSLDNLETLCRKCHIALHNPNPNKPNKIVRVCEYCGVEFEIVPSRMSNGHGKYCSMVCRRAAGK